MQNLGIMHIKKLIRKAANKYHTYIHNYNFKENIFNSRLICSNHVLGSAFYSSNYSIIVGKRNNLTFRLIKLLCKESFQQIQEANQSVLSIHHYQEIF